MAWIWQNLCQWFPKYALQTTGGPRDYRIYSRLSRIKKYSSKFDQNSNFLKNFKQVSYNWYKTYKYEEKYHFY
jgi:hypothetical protein